MRNVKVKYITKLLIFCVAFISFSQFLILFSINKKKHNLIKENSFHTDDKLAWPPIKVFVYPNNSRHTSDCLYPPEMPNRYVNEKGFWFQRMLEPTIHRQFLESPILTNNEDEADLFFIPHYSRMCSGLDNGMRWKEIPIWMSTAAKHFKRYSTVDHLIIHSVPNYGDKPADSAVMSSRAPIIGLIDFKSSHLKRLPRKFDKSIDLPFIT